jgi:hypothetical protein
MYHQRTESNYYRIKIDGRLQIEDFIDWIKNVENFFEYMNIQEHKQVKLVAYKLKGGASAWWEQHQNNRRLAGKRPIERWTKMKELMHNRFLPVDYQQTLYGKYLQCRQRNRSVGEYTKEFYRLNARNILKESEMQQITRYTGGLREDIQD